MIIELYLLRAEHYHSLPDDDTLRCNLSFLPNVIAKQFFLPDHLMIKLDIDLAEFASLTLYKIKDSRWFNVDLFPHQNSVRRRDLNTVTAVLLVPISWTIQEPVNQAVSVRMVSLFMRMAHV